MKISKKILAIALAAIMVISVLPLSAFATEWTDEAVWGPELQTGDILTSNVEHVSGLEEYTLTLPAGGYAQRYTEAVGDSDLVFTEWRLDWFETEPDVGCLMIIDMNNYELYYPYNENGITNQWYVLDVNHENRTIVLSGCVPGIPTVNTYTATWMNYNGAVLKTDEEIEEGTTPTYFGKMPAKPSTDTHFYAFSGWTPAVEPIAEDTTYTATFTEMAKSSTVDGCETFVTKSFEDTREFIGEHIRAKNSKVTATDTGWSANTNFRTTVEGRNGEKIVKLVLTRASSYGAAPVVYVNGTAVSGTLSGDVYTFDNLNATYVHIGTGSNVWFDFTDLVAYYKEARTYTVTWKNADGTVLETDTDVAEGTVPTYDKATPTKADDAQYTYTFAGWSDGQTTYGLTDTLPAVTADVTYTATFTATPKPAEPTSTVSFTKVTDASQITADNIGTCTADEATAWVQENWDAVYSNESFAYYVYYTETTGLNIGIIFPGVSKDYISNYIYTNREDDRDIEGLTYSLGRGEAVYLCTPAAPPAPPTYTVTWQNADGTELETDTDVAEGTVPTYNGATPTKADDAQYTYTFAGWTPEVTAVTGDVTYTAQFTPVAKFSVFVKKLTGGTITVSNVTGLTTVAQLKDLLVTETGVPASAMRLIFAGKQLADDKTLGEYNIQKESTLHLVIRTYTITWKSDEATIIDTTNVAYGETPTHEDPAAYEDADYTYTFAGWTPEVTAVTGEATYTATYTATAKTQPVAEANGVKYESFDEALRAISTVNAKGQFLANGTLRLLADCAGNGYSIASGSNLIIDFNGKTYTVDSEPLAGSTGTKTQAFQLLKNSTVIFKNGTLYSEVAKMLVQNYSDLTLEGMTLTLDNPNYYPSYTLSNNNGDTMIIDTTINVNPAGGFAFDVCRFASYPSVSVTVTGDSEINGDVEIFASKGDPKEGLSLNLNGGTMSGNIVVDESVKTILQNAPESAVIKKAAAFTKDAPEGYVWNEEGILEPVAPVNGGSLTLDDGVKFNAYLDADAYGVDVNEAIVKITYNANSDLNNKTVNVVTETKDLSTVEKYVDETSPYNGAYKFTLAQAPAQMNEDIVIELYANADETGPVASITTSAAELCEAVIASEETSQGYKDLCASLLDYGRAAQIYFSYDLENLAAAYNNAQVTTLGYADMRTTAAALNGVPFKGVSFTVLSTTEWNIAVREAQTVDTITGVPGASASATVLHDKSDAIKVTGIDAADFAKAFTVYTNSGSIQFSAAMIVRGIVKNSTNTNYQDLARAFYLYGVQAESFFA